jgi:hypothetical protein
MEEPWETDEPEDHPLTTPSPRGGKPEPELPGTVHVQPGAVYFS